MRLQPHESRHPFIEKPSTGRSRAPIPASRTRSHPQRPKQLEICSQPDWQAPWTRRQVFVAQTGMRSESNGDLRLPFALYQGSRKITVPPRAESTPNANPGTIPLFAVSNRSR